MYRAYNDRYVCHEQHRHNDADNHSDNFAHGIAHIYHTARYHTIPPCCFGGMRLSVC